MEDLTLTFLKDFDAENGELVAENAAITGRFAGFWFSKSKTRFAPKSDRRQASPLAYSKRLIRLNSAPPLDRNRGKRIRCYDSIRTRCTLLFWGDLMRMTRQCLLTS